MDLINQKIGQIGDIHVSIVDGKIVMGADASLDLKEQLEKLRGAHQADLIGKALDLVEGAIGAIK